MENKANKLDQLFREKLRHDELAPEEDYWPFLEEKLSRPSFYKFGWKHFNIYNTSLVALLLLIPLFYFLSNPDEKKQTPVPVADSISTTGASQKIIYQSHPVTTIRPEKKKQEKKSFVQEPLAEQESAIIDSLPAEVGEEKISPAEPAPVKVLEEKPKPKPKKIIYVVQQDTIVEKDTVKVRRKRKN